MLAFKYYASIRIAATSLLTLPISLVVLPITLVSPFLLWDIYGPKKEGGIPVPFIVAQVFFGSYILWGLITAIVQSFWGMRGIYGGSIEMRDVVMLDRSSTPYVASVDLSRRSTFVFALHVNHVDLEGLFAI